MSEPTPKHPRVWVVDDSRGQAEHCRRALEREYDVAVFYDGASVLERLAHDAPDILVLDWHMPELSGLDVCRFVRESRGPSVLPILILTATAGRSDLVAAFEAGANDFVRKPFDEGELNARIAGLERSRQLYAQLNTAEASLRDEARFRERFIAVLGHDLRQPLTTITMLAQSLSREGEERATRLLAAAQRMGRMIDDILDLSRTRLGAGITMRRVPTSLATLVEKVVEEIRGAHAGRAIDTHFTGDVTGEWDAERLAQVCSNLLDNAVKHGAPNTPVVVELRGAADDVTLIIRNEGKPISAASLVTLFDAFRQGSAEVAGRGLGLGLFIVEQIVKAHGGSVSVTSDLDATTFTVVLSRRAPGNS
jgi:signal transduction histidine kinase